MEMCRSYALQINRMRYVVVWATTVLKFICGEGEGRRGRTTHNQWDIVGVVCLRSPGRWGKTGHTELEIPARPWQLLNLVRMSSSSKWDRCIWYNIWGRKHRSNLQPTCRYRFFKMHSFFRHINFYVVPYMVVYDLELLLIHCMNIHVWRCTDTSESWPIHADRLPWQDPNDSHTIGQVKRGNNRRVIEHERKEAACKLHFTFFRSVGTVDR